MNGPLDRRDLRPVPGLHHQQPRLRRGDRRQPTERGRRAVVVDLDLVEQAGAGPTGPNVAEILLENLDRLSREEEEEAKGGEEGKKAVEID